MIFKRVRVKATLDEFLVYAAQSSTAMMRIQILFLTDCSHRFFFNTKPYTGQYSQPVMVVAKWGSSFDPSRNRAGSTLFGSNQNMNLRILVETMRTPSVQFHPLAREKKLYPGLPQAWPGLAGN